MSAWMQQQQASAMALQMAVQELKAMTEVYNNIVASCHTKCVPPKYSDGDLNKGESVCVDRCVAKYMEVHQRVGAKLSKLQGAQQPEVPPAEGA